MARPGRAWQKHLDFVLYDVATTAVVLAIELDDRSHAAEGRRRRDAFVDAVLEGCGVRLLRVRAAGRYEVEELRGWVVGAVNAASHAKCSKTTHISICSKTGENV